MSFYDHLNNGEKYYCDRCGIVSLRADEYYGNIRHSNDTRFCDECRNYIVIRKFKCLKCGNSGTQRNERILPKVCCEENVIWLK